MLGELWNLRVRIFIKTNRKDRREFQASLRNWVVKNLSAESNERNIFDRYG